MRRALLVILTFVFSAAYGQTARQVLDKAAAAVSNKSGVTASFTIKGQQMNTSGTISVKGRKFTATTPQATVWFDGKTQWTYMKKNDEVNVSTPTESQLASVNPYNFIFLYKQGYNATLAKKGSSHEVHLTATDKKKAIQEMYLVVNPKTSIPSQIRLRQQQGWLTIDVSHFRPAKLADGIFRFNSKDYPTAEVIDLR